MLSLFHLPGERQHNDANSALKSQGELNRVETLKGKQTPFALITDINCFHVGGKSFSCLPEL